MESIEGESDTIIELCGIWIGNGQASCHLALSGSEMKLLNVSGWTESATDQ